MTAAVDVFRYEQHLRTLDQRLEQVLEGHGFDALLVLAGEPLLAFRDDNPYPFRPNPYFVHWVPLAAEKGASVLLRPGRRPILFLVRDLDIWHAAPAELDDSWVATLELRRCGAPALPGADDLSGIRRLAVIGDGEPGGLSCKHEWNPASVLAELDFLRAYKTPHELDLVRAATHRAVRAHGAAAGAFSERLPEYGIRRRYLGEIGALGEEMPYSPIIALNEHSATLHYDACARVAPDEHRSFLIDAGASMHGYHADITRSYAAAEGDWAELCRKMDALQLGLIESITVGEPFPALHARMHEALASLLCDAGVLRCGPEAALARGLTRVFCPHGLGHYLGAQVHDVGGRLASRAGDELPVDPEHPFLRLLRPVESGNVFTIEPGLYFIDGLLGEHARDRAIDWARVAQLKPFGGIRVEDNVAVVEGEVLNLSREAFATLP